MPPASNRARSVLATVVGYVIVALVAYWLFGALIGTIRWLVRAVLTIVVLGALATVYLKLKTPRSR